MNKNLLAELLAMLEPIATECLCLDPPREEGNDEGHTDPNDPKQHSSYCPIYIYRWVMERMGEEHNNVSLNKQEAPPQAR
jgi:hypothetical protein